MVREAISYFNDTMRQGRLEKKYNIKTLSTERCENFDTLYINK